MSNVIPVPYASPDWSEVGLANQRLWVWRLPSALHLEYPKDSRDKLYFQNPVHFYKACLLI